MTAPCSPPPLLSLILVAYKSLPDLQRCLPTIYNNPVSFSYEVIVVDNGGEDGLGEWLQGNYPQVVHIVNPTNSGYAGGNNLGLRRATGHWTLFLNPDTEILPGALEQLVATARQLPNAFITPKLLNSDGTINACGNEMHYTGITTCRGLNAPATAYSTLQPVLLLSGAAFLAPTAALNELGGFDETYFMYFEDTDLSLRARLAGYSLWCEARAAIIHHYQLSMNPTKFYYLERNRLLTLLKVYSRKTVVRLLPAMVLTEAMTWAYSLRSPSFLRARFRTYAWLWPNRRKILAKRRIIQGDRQISDAIILQNCLVSLPFTQLAGPAIGKLLNTLTRPLFRLVKPRVGRILVRQSQLSPALKR